MKTTDEVLNEWADVKASISKMFAVHINECNEISRNVKTLQEEIRESLRIIEDEYK